jgi:carbon monoxide dehydrogenase subunit G
MAEGKATATVAAAPDEVWAVVGDFGGLAEWMDSVESCEVIDDVRVVKTMGIEVHEALQERDEDAHRISYSIVKAPIELDHHLATITVEPDGDGARVTWEYEIRPDELAGMFGPIYEGSVQAVKQRFDA